MSLKQKKRSSDSCSEDLPSPTTYREPKRAKSDGLPAKVPTLDKSSFRGIPDSAKLRQTSLASFIKANPETSTSMSMTDTSSSTLVRRLPLSPSKIPLPASPIKRREGLPPGKKLFIGGSNIFGSSKHMSSLSTLSTALEKLAMPPPSRPNTSLGFNVSLEERANTRAGLSLVKDDNTVVPSSGTFARPTASSLKRHATLAGPSRVNFMGRMKGRSGALGRTATGIFGPGLAKPSIKASRKTSLPSVIASPVKGGTIFDENPVGNTHASLGRAEENLEQEQQLNVTTLPEPSDSKTPEEQGKDASLVIEGLTSTADKGKQPEGWDSRRASNALHALSQSLSVLPKTPPKLAAPGTRTGLRSSSGSSHATWNPRPKSVVDMKNKGKAKGHTDGAASQRNAPANGDAVDSPTEGGSTGTKSVLKVLKKCAMFVDVRTDDGDDAGSLFVDMLRGLGARILGRVGQSCTHVVYKNGSASTLTRYRLLNDPKPVVVGIAWVVECVEQRSRVDETRFKVDLELVNVAGTNKRRRSMLPKHISPSIPATLSSEGDDNEGKGQADYGSSSPAQDADSSIRSAKDEDDLPPLERARRRRCALPGGQTRLI